MVKDKKSLITPTLFPPLGAGKYRLPPAHRVEHRYVHWFKDSMSRLLHLVCDINTTRGIKSHQVIRIKLRDYDF